ncbi:MAG TPA: histidine phosphatase family protein [Solirubrobacteraceae bacterium]|nr:histidine phosphatase family protein [Solirubrobacteraceae bacterium]
MSSAGQEVFLIRHGETEWSKSGQHTSRTDLRLTGVGEEQSRAVGRKVAGHAFALVLSSPMGRAVRTAELAGLGDRVELRDDMLEWDYGSYEGVTTRDIRSERPDWLLWRDGAPGGETAEQVGARVDRVIAEARAAEGDVALFAHGHVLRVLGARWIELGPSAGGRLALSTATISVLGYEREMPVIWRWNER